MKATKISHIGVLTLSLIGCSTENYNSYHSADEVKYARELCDSNTLGGMTEGFKLALDAKRTELNSASATIGFEKYKHLQQQLQNYSVEWEILNEEIQIACKSYAVQLQRSRVTSYWESSIQVPQLQQAEANYQARLQQARDFIVKIQQARITND